MHILILLIVCTCNYNLLHKLYSVHFLTTSKKNFCTTVQMESEWTRQVLFYLKNSIGNLYWNFRLLDKCFFILRILLESLLEFRLLDKCFSILKSVSVFQRQKQSTQISLWCLKLILNCNTLTLFDLNSVTV